MKKTAMILAVFVFLIAGCGNSKNGNSEGASDLLKVSSGSAAGTSGGAVYEIKENMFITQINDILLNHKDYLGKTIKLEGIFVPFEWEGNYNYYVIRGAPGCCGDDGEIGFEVSWLPSHNGSDDGANRELYPQRNDWVEAQGKLGMYERSDMSFLYIALSEINVLEKRGAEFVTR